MRITLMNQAGWPKIRTRGDGDETLSIRRRRGRTRGRRPQARGASDPRQVRERHRIANGSIPPGTTYPCAATARVLETPLARRYARNGRAPLRLVAEAIREPSF